MLMLCNNNSRYLEKVERVYLADRHSAAEVLRINADTDETDKLFQLVELTNDNDNEEDEVDATESGDSEEVWDESPWIEEPESDSNNSGESKN